MQQYLPPSGNDQWHNPVLKDVSFIRRHRRYPLNRHTSRAVITMTILLLVLLTIIAAIAAQFTTGIKVSIIPAGAALLVITLFIFRLFRSFYFISVPTGYPVARNIELLSGFLTDKRILVFHHPAAPEVFQIISRPLDSLKGKREVLVFIADNKCILINSHFISEADGAMQPVGATNHRRMAAELKAWLETKTPDGYLARIQ